MAKDRLFEHFSWRNVCIWTLGLLSLVCYVIIARLSWSFMPGRPATEYPTVWVLLVFCIAFLCYWPAQILVLRMRDCRFWIGWIIVSSVLFRVVMLASAPIHEVDIYRYLWDGAVTAQGISPYRFSPQMVIDAADGKGAAVGDSDERTRARDDLKHLVQLRNRCDSLADALDRIHFGHLSSPYPPVSQWVFAMAARWTPDDSTPWMRLVIMKCLLVFFDLATLLLVLMLLNEAGLSLTWSLTYGWSPLVLKEIAGSGHLDSIAICLTTLSLWLLLLSVRSATSSRQNMWWCRLVAISGTVFALALAIGAKLYPVVLLPMIVILWWRKLGAIYSIGGGIAILVVTMFLFRPMLSSSSPGGARVSIDEADSAGIYLDRIFHPFLLRRPKSFRGYVMFRPRDPQRVKNTSAVADLTCLATKGLETPRDETDEISGLEERDSQAVPLSPPAAQPVSSSQAGLGEFLGRWEMNDLLFLILLENLRPQTGVPPKSRPWFTLMPEDWSQWIVIRWSEFLHWMQYGFWGRQTPVDGRVADSEKAYRRASFLLVRCLTAGVFVVIALWLAFRMTGLMQQECAWCRAAMLTLAWFWLLCPTQNPWYWCWVLPLVPFARFKAWHLMSACTMLYYIRFWLLTHFPEPPVLGSRYDGEHFFYFVVVWIEFAPCLLWLGLAWLKGRRNPQEV